MLVVDDQKYEKIKLVEIRGRKFIRKKLAEKEKLFYQTCPEKLYILKPGYHGQYAYFPYLEEGIIIKARKEDWIKSVEAIADFQETVNSSDFDFLPRVNYKAEVKQMAQVGIYEPDLKPLWKGLIEEFGNLGNGGEVCHGDLIGLNILKSNGGIKIIDWEDAEIGWGEFDIGRLLGDLYYQNPSYEHRYYNFDWHDELRDKYISKRKEINQNYDEREGKRRIILGEIWNYLGPIEGCLKHGESDSEWYRTNKTALLETVIKLG
jgi:thiamine kinase-like enzyme